MEDIRISVVIPTYNRPFLLQQCLESIVTQSDSFNNFEIIIVNDGNGGNMDSLINKLNAKDIVKYFKQDHKGPAAARNLGIKFAKGEIIGFIDDDATCAKDWLKKALKIFEKDINLAGVEGKILLKEGDITPLTNQTLNLSGGLYATCNIFYRKEVLNKVGGFDERFSSSFREDTDLAFRILEKGYKIIFSPELIVYHHSSKPSLLGPFRQARKYYFDPLLYKKFPKLYYEKVDVYNFLGIKLIHPRRRFYLMFIILCLLNLIFYFIKERFYTPLIFATGLVYLIILIGHLRFWKKSRMYINDILLTIPIFFAVPFVYYFYLVKGMTKFKKIILW